MRYNEMEERVAVREGVSERARERGEERDTITANLGGADFASGVESSVSFD